MAAVNPNRRDVLLEIERLVANRTNADGEVDLREVENDLKAFLLGHTHLLDVAKIAHDYIGQFDEARRPRPSAGQTSLFDPDLLIPIGKKQQRVRMEQATREHLIAWHSVELSAFSTTLAAHQGKTTYITERLNAWGSERHLGEVERNQFGWTS